MRYGLKEDVIEKICSVFASFNEVEQVILYGSRAKNTFKPGSDIDLTLRGKNLDLSLLNKIAWDLDDLLLPYTFDLSMIDQIENEDLVDHIERVGQLFYQKASNS